MMKDESCYCPVDDYHFKVVHVGMFNTQHGHVVCINAACVQINLAHKQITSITARQNPNWSLMT